MMWPQFKCSFGFNKSTPSLWGVSKSKPTRHCPCSPSSSRHCTSKTLHHIRPSSLRLAFGCSSSHFTFGLFLDRLRLLIVAFSASRYCARPLALPFASPALIVVHSLASARPLPVSLSLVV
ncbi:hypothetical protein Scep_010048 [Stephania cephalantha]|uniref:Uncharacterized protein n=1 Tax=Stephania cephalantha TaxID=152367 RepID=A0AAP0JUC8_9MAGN